MQDDFSARYRLLKCVLVDDGIRTHNAQERASGRVVMVHISDAAGPEEVESLRAQLAALPLTDRNRVLEAVTLPYGFAIVTEFLPAPLTFRGFLAAAPAVVASAPPEATTPRAAHTVVDATSAISAESFTGVFGTPEAPALPAAFGAPIVTQVSVQLPEPSAPAPAGEFTRMFAPSHDAEQPLADAPMPPSPAISPLSPSAPAKADPGEFTRLFGAPETAAPMPDTVRASPMHEAPPPAFSPLTPERQLESPPVEPRHRVVSSQPQYLAGIHQDGPSPIAPNVVSGGLNAGLSPRIPVAPAPPPPHVSPLFAAAGPTAPVPSAPSLTPTILPPPVFNSGTATPLSSLGGAAPLVNASAGPSEFTRLISSAAEPVVPPLAPTAALTPGRAVERNTRRLPNGLIVTINAVLLIAALLMWFVLRRPVPTVQTVLPGRPILPAVPSAPQLPSSPAR